MGGFSDEGKRYIVRDVHLIDRADSDLWNDRMRVQIDQRGRVASAGFLQPNFTDYAEGLRAFYVRDDATGAFWSAPHEPVQADADAFEFSIGLADVRWTVERDGIRVGLEMVVPRDDDVEVWSATVTNVSRRARRVSLYSYFPVGLRALLAQRAWFDGRLNLSLHEYFPYYVHYKDYYTLRKLKNLVFCASDRRPDGIQLSLADFAGRRGPNDPDQIRLPRLPKAPAAHEIANERSGAIYQFVLGLRPGQSQTVRFVFGPAKDRTDAERLARKYRRAGALERARRAAEAFLDSYAPAVRIRTPDREFDHYINHWQSRRSLMLARTIRFNYAPQGRNVIQDAMGGAYVDPSSSRQWFTRIWGHQHQNGWLPHGMPFAEGVKQIEINSIPHKDINSWGPGAVAFYLYETGDFSILDEPIPFSDAPARRASLYEHVCLGLEWLLNDRTRRGLSRIGQGDWNDPLNMAGLKERGESIWLTEAMAAALDAWAPVARRRGDVKRAIRYEREADKTRRAINRLAWDGQWYTRGFTDAGKPFGVKTDREGTVFLNSQSWAMIAGAATARRVTLCMRAVEKYLMTPSGPMLLGPAFTAMREDIGKLTQKIPGWNENGSIYCHAATFYAYALYCARRPDEAFDVLRRLLPGYGGNTIERTGQLPLYIPNFYRGADAGRKAGLSSHAPNTGTASWYYRTAVAMLLGVRAEEAGMRLDPQLPRGWRRAAVWRLWRGAEFDIQIVRGGVKRTAVWLDGRPLRGTLVPVQPAGSWHWVKVAVPE
jgi:cellobionic acid phosphorylase